jgi:hypothetical protein
MEATVRLLNGPAGVMRTPGCGALLWTKISE